MSHVATKCLLPTLIAPSKHRRVSGGGRGPKGCSVGQKIKKYKPQIRRLQRMQFRRAHVPPEEKDDRALKEALNLLRGTITDAAVPPNPKAAVP